MSPETLETVKFYSTFLVVILAIWILCDVLFNQGEE